MAEKTTRLAYSKDEDNAICKYIADYAQAAGDRGSTKGNAIWKEMESKKITQHSWMSMKDRYLKQLSKKAASLDSPDKMICNETHFVEEKKNAVSSISETPSAEERKNAGSTVSETRPAEERKNAGSSVSETLSVEERKNAGSTVSETLSAEERKNAGSTVSETRPAKERKNAGSAVSVTRLAEERKNAGSTVAAVDMRKERQPYTPEEDNAILRYLQMFGKECGEPGSVKGNMIWKQMQQNEITSRSWQSMKDRYLKYLHHLEAEPNDSSQLTFLMYDGKPIICLKEPVCTGVDKENDSIPCASRAKIDVANNVLNHRENSQEEIIRKDSSEKRKRRPLFSHSKNYSLVDDITACKADGPSSDMSIASSRYHDNISNLGCTKTPGEKSSLSICGSVVDDLVKLSESLSINDG